MTLRKNINICTLLTGVGRSAVAVIGCRGPSAIDSVWQCFEPASNRQPTVGDIRFGNWVGPVPAETLPDAPLPQQHRAGEAVIVLLRQQRDGEAEIEVHCHGGSAATKRIMDDLHACGVLPLKAEAWLIASGADSENRSVVETRLAAEARTLLSQCQTVRTAQIALDQLRGGLTAWAETWLVQFSQAQFSQAQLTRAQLSRAPDNEILEALRDSVNAMLLHAPLTTRLDEPLRIVVAGLPNVGKSSLINAILGYDRSITTPIAGTTRDVLHAETVIDGIAVRLSDTAGIHASDEPIEREGIERARREVMGADLILAVAAPGYPAIDFGPLLTPRIDVFNKIDLADVLPSDASVCTAAISGQGIEELLSRIAAELGQGFPAAGAAVPINSRQVKCLEAIAQAKTSQQAVAKLAESFSPKP